MRYKVTKTIYVDAPNGLEACIAAADSPDVMDWSNSDVTRVCSACEDVNATVCAECLKGN